MALHDRLPGAAEFRRVHSAAHIAGQLNNVDAGAGLVQRMKQHALLHGGQTVNIFNALTAANPLVEVLLAQPRQWKIRRRVTTGLRGAAVLDDLPQAL